MTTTCVRDSIVGDQWIQQTAQQVPLQKILNPDTGQFEGDFRTGPVRLSFFDDSLFELPPPMLGPNGQPQGESKYGSHLLFTPYADFTPLYEEYYRLCGTEFPDHYDAGSGQYLGLQSPFKDQAEKAAKYAGYTPGCIFLNSTSKFRPQVVDIRKNIIVDKARVFPGMWAICVVRGYASGKGNPLFKKGIQFGLQSVMIIGEDSKFGSSGPDASKLYAGVNITAPPIRAGQVANIPGPAGMAPPPPAGIAGYTAPGGGAIRPGMAPQGAVPQQHWTPPAGAPPAPLAPPGVAAFTPPMAAMAGPVAYAPAPAATVSPSNAGWTAEDEAAMYR